MTLEEVRLVSFGVSERPAVASQKTPQHSSSIIILDAREVQAIHDITQDEIIDLFMTTIHPFSTVRKKFSIHIRSQQRPAQATIAPFSEQDSRLPKVSDTPITAVSRSAQGSQTATI